ncbi:MULTISPECIES: hypothetical protein [unclassified Nostoc]|nr:MULTISPECIES: hypothetical protein [unclassified Nostoc]MDZ8033739.1 hypothetical protein [Nostoc sp. DedSLP04]MDZ8128167.1 hypothetical protein [Nostoc sp. DedQUE07]
MQNSDTTFAASTSKVPLGIFNQQVWAKDIEDLGIAKKRLNDK